MKFKIKRVNKDFPDIQLYINGCRMLVNHDIIINMPEFTKKPDNCLKCPFGERNIGGKVPYICNLYRTSFCEEDAKKYCPLEEYHMFDIPDDKPDCQNCKFSGHVLDEKVGTDVCYGCKDHNMFKAKGENK